MAAAEEPGTLRIIVESPAGDQDVIMPAVRTELLSTAEIKDRARLDVAESVVAQRRSPTPATGRTVLGLARHRVPQNGYLIFQHKSDAADTADTSDFEVRLGIILRDLTRRGQPNEYRVDQLTLADRDTARIADDPTFSTSQFVGVLAFKAPTGLEYMLHGEQFLKVMDDTA